jgi:hypothetical protein
MIVAQAPPSGETATGGLLRKAQPHDPLRPWLPLQGEDLMIARHTRIRLFSTPGHVGDGPRLQGSFEREQLRRSRSAQRKTRSGSRSLDKRMARLIIGMCLLVLLLSVGGSGCGIGQPPVMTLEQWEAQYNRVRSSDSE